MCFHIGDTSDGTDLLEEGLLLGLQRALHSGIEGRGSAFDDALPVVAATADNPLDADNAVDALDGGELAIKCGLELIEARLILTVPLAAPFARNVFEGDCESAESVVEGETESSAVRRRGELRYAF